MKKEKARGMYLEIVKGEYLFISIPAVKHYFIKPGNIIGNFSHNCYAYILKKNNEMFAVIKKNPEYYKI